MASPCVPTRCRGWCCRPLVIVLDQLTKWLGADLAARVHRDPGDRGLLELVPHLQHRRGVQLPERCRRLAEVRSSSCWPSAISGLLGWWLARTPRGDWRKRAAVRAGDRRRARQRDRPPAARPRGRFHPVVLARPLLAGVQHRRLGDRRRRGRHRPVRPVRSRQAQPATERGQRYNRRHGRPARQSPRFLRRRRPRHRDRQARHRDARRADLRAPRSRAQPLRGRRPASTAARSSSRNSTKCPTTPP